MTTLAAQMRLGTLEITVALLAIAVVALRPRSRLLAEIGRLVPIQAVIRVYELGKEHLFEGLVPLTIGREREADLVLSDPEVSRRHAGLESQNGVVFLRDLESRNGTFLNGRRIAGALEVRSGDEIDVGTTRLILENLQPWT